MNKRIWTLICALLATAALGGGALAAGGGGAPAPTASERAAAGARAQEALPGSQTSLSAAQEAGHRLTLSVAAEAAKALPGSDSAAFDAPPPASAAKKPSLLPLAQLGWKAHLVGGVVAANEPQVVEFAVDWPGIGDADANLLTWRMRVEPGTPLRRYPRLGSVGVAAARAQLASNLDVLERALGSAFERARIVVVPVDAGAGLFGLEADVRVNDFDAVKAHLGDVVNGLATGLVGDETAVVEGLAVNLIADDGNRAGWFRSERTGVGIGISHPALGTAPPAVDAEFPNLTGGPPTSNSASSGGKGVNP